MIRANSIAETEIASDADFRAAVEAVDPSLLAFDSLGTLQVNLGNLCNHNCAHCHVKAGPNGSNIMPMSVMIRVIDFAANCTNLTVDLTGGSPELNPDFKFLLDGLSRNVRRLMVRTNLTVFFEPGLEWVPKWYADHGVVIVASLPCYTRQNVDKQRGDGVFDRSIESIRRLNDLGYGGERLELNLVYNPGAGFLPGAQQQLEADYKKHLRDEFGIVFNRLFTITNAPIGRFKDYLEANGGLKQYLKLLADNFNPDAAAGIMCRTLVSVDYRGVAYNCDFNQALDLPLTDAGGKTVTIDSIRQALGSDLGIITGPHCFCCTAGAGSSCTGSLV